MRFMDDDNQQMQQAQDEERRAQDDDLIACFECERAFAADDMTQLDDDELRCHACADNQKALFKLDQRDRFLDDPRRW